MYTLAHRPIPVASLVLDPREIELMLRSLEESIEEEAEYGNPALAAELATLQRRLANAHKSLITH
jgi:hypothetical protein